MSCKETRIPSYLSNLTTELTAYCNPKMMERYVEGERRETGEREGLIL